MADYKNCIRCYSTRSRTHWSSWQKDGCPRRRKCWQQRSRTRRNCFSLPGSKKKDRSSGLSFYSFYLPK